MILCQWPWLSAGRMFSHHSDSRTDEPWGHLQDASVAGQISHQPILQGLLQGQVQIPAANLDLMDWQGRAKINYPVGISWFMLVSGKFQIV
jgi:hypothetical protein